MKTVNLDHFFQFWSHHNQTIIQVLIVLTLLFIVALVFMTLFGAKEAEPEIAGGVSLSPELETSLKRALEAQSNVKAAVYDFSSGDATAPKLQAVSDRQSTGNIPEELSQMTKELERAKSEIVEREKAVQELKAQLVQVSNQAQQAAAGGGSSELQARIKELEARLAEYDIISEDIADLSRYKEENEKLKAQLQGQDRPAVNASAAEVEASSGVGVEAAASTNLKPEQPVTAIEQEPAPNPNLQVVSDETPLKVMAASAESASAEATEESEVTEATNATVDDDLMKEFAAAVEGQKTAESQEAAQQTAENEDLMGQFEDFVQKKDKA